MHYVYFIRMRGTDYVKIGNTKNVVKRVADLQVSNPYKLVIETIKEYLTYQEALAAERAYHETFQQYHVRGEWFELPESLLLADHPFKFVR